MDLYSEIENLRSNHRQHQALRFKRIVSQAERPDRLFGINGVHFLLKLLERSNDLIEEALFAIERHKTLTLILTARAHFETTASAGFFLRKLEKFYQNEVDEDTLSNFIGKLSTGSRIKDAETEDVKFPDPINVLTLIDEADKKLKSMGGHPDMLRSCYDVLSEYNHPNLMGTTYKTKVNLEEGTVTFLTDAESFEKHSKSIILKLLISADLYLMFYKKAFELLQQNENMPVLER